jgi:hypothetical protein
VAFEKKPAFEAVIGVLGVVAGPIFGGGVRFPRFTTLAPSYKAEILAAVGVLSGSRFSGGSRSGCRFLLLLVPPFSFLSCLEPASIVKLRWYPGLPAGLHVSLSLEGVRVESVDNMLDWLLVSNGKLDLRTVKNG